MMNKVNDASLLHQQIKPKTIVVHSDLRLKLLDTGGRSSIRGHPQSSVSFVKSLHKRPKMDGTDKWYSQVA